MTRTQPDADSMMPRAKNGVLIRHEFELVTAVQFVKRIWDPQQASERRKGL